MDMKAGRVFLIVLDSCGAGEAHDACDFGDVGTNTIKSVSKSEYFKIDNLRSMGYGNIDGLDFLGRVANQKAVTARLRELSKGKDTTIGHWEIAGLVSDKPLPTYPDGFPKEVLDEFSKRTKRGVLCNKPYSGTEVISDYGREHIASGDLIVYTSADSVFQIAAHTSVVPVEQLYKYCRIARELLVGKHGVGRVIARPFEGEYPNFRRTSQRHDFSLEPYGKTVLDLLKDNGYDVISVGKIYDIFAGRGLTEENYTHSNEEGMDITLQLQKKDFHGLCFTNLVDFDMLYGHRNDIDGYAKALSSFDAWLPHFISGMRDDDVLMITADHGCDPGFKLSTDHSREYVPLFIYNRNLFGKNLGTIDGFNCVAATVANLLSCDYPLGGNALI